MPRSPMRDAICQLLREGKSYNAIAREFDCAKATVAYHARRSRDAGSRQNPAAANRYDWAAIRAFHDEGHSFVECRERFGFSGGAGGRRSSAGISYRARRNSQATPRARHASVA